MSSQPSRGQVGHGAEQPGEHPPHRPESVEQPDLLTGARTKARKHALDVLFEADQRGVGVIGVLRQHLASPDQITREYTVEIVEGVTANVVRIDELLMTYAHGWTLDRMPAVDRALLRMATWELLYNDGVPDAVAIDEAVLLARTLSTDESPGFVNGLLGRLLETKATT